MSLIGTVKNAGKTTVLVRLLSELYETGTLTPGISSIGRDGEKTDLVTLTEKPEVPVREGTLVASASRLLEGSSFTRQLLYASGISTPLGEVYVARARSFGYADIGGPSRISDMKRIRDRLFALGADLVLIDGAADRRSLGAAELAEGVILCSGAAYSRDLQETLNHTAFLAGLFSLPRWTEDQAERTLFLPGAVLEPEARRLAELGVQGDRDVLCLDDPSKLMFSAGTGGLLERRGFKLMLKSCPKLYGVAVNPRAPGGWDYGAAFAEKLRERVSCPVMDAQKGGVLDACSET